jgi:hypothetical protein
METDLGSLRAAVVAAVDILGGTTDPADDRVQRALALLTHALAAPPDLSAADTGAVEDMAPIDLVRPQPRRLSDYRQVRAMTIPQFTAFLGIAHFEYAHVVHRQKIDLRLRDQIAFRLGVPWQAIAEFMPREPPTSRPRPIPIPPPATAEPPDEPWNLVEVVSGPHTTALPANALPLGDPVTQAPTNFILYDPWTTEEGQLPPEGYSARERRERYEEAEDGAECWWRSRTAKRQPPLEARSTG